MIIYLRFFRFLLRKTWACFYTVEFGFLSGLESTERNPHTISVFSKNSEAVHDFGEPSLAMVSLRSEVF